MKPFIASILTILISSNTVQAQNIDDDTNSLTDSEQMTLLKEEQWTVQGKLDTNSSKMQDGSYYQIHIFEGKKGETIVLDLISDDFDGYLFLFDSKEKIAENDNGGENKNSKIVISLPKTELYIIMVNTAKPEERGNYRLSKNKVTEKDITLVQIDELNTKLLKLYQQGKYDTATLLAEETLELTLSVYSDLDHPDVTTSLNNLAFLYSEQGRLEEAEPLYKEALEMTKRLFEEDHPDVATSLNNLASLYSEQGRLEEAELLYKEALEMTKRLFEGDHPFIATSLNNLASLYSKQGRLEKAEPLYKEALEMTKRLFEGDHPSTATSLNNLAFLYSKQGRLEKAEPLYKEALEMTKRLFEGDHPSTATSLNSLAHLYDSQGKLGEAEPLYKEALEMRQRLFRANHPSIVTSLNNLASLYFKQGRLGEIEPLYREALEMTKGLFGEDHPYIATSLNNLASLYSKQGRLEEAEPLFKEALAMTKRLFERDHPDVAGSLNNLAGLYFEQRKLEKAESLYRESLEMTKRLFEEDHPDVAGSLNNLAGLYFEQRKLEKAESLYRESLEMKERLFEGNHPSIVTSLNNLSNLFWQQKRIPQTIDYFVQASEMEENILLQNLIGSESTKQSYFDTFFGTTNATISLHQQFAPDNLDATNLALTTIFRRKGRLLDSGSQTFNLIRQNLTPENQKLLDDLSAINTQISHLATRRTSLFINKKTLSVEDYNQKARELNQNLERLETEAEKLETQLARVSEQFRVETEKVTIEAVQKQIPANTALVEMMLYSPYNPQTDEYGEPRYVAYILDSEGKIRSVDLGEAQIIDRQAQIFMILLKQEVSIDPIVQEQNLQQLLQASRQLDELLMQPIRNLLDKDTKRLLISPDSQLNLISFEALKDENDRYLIENYAVSYLTSGRDLLRFTIDAQPQSHSVVVANPTFDLDRTAKTKDDNSLASAQDSSNITQQNKYSNKERSANFIGLKAQQCCEQLDGTREEAEAIVPLLDNATVLTQSQATEEAIKTVKAPEILHIATHGYFLPDRKREIPQQNPNDKKIIVNESDNPLLRSGLALAGFNPKQNKFEGALTALEVAGLNLYGTKLVVLSACDTGLGDVRNGDGVYGLRRSLVLAGSESQIISLWKVDDDSTKDLMVSYYQKLKQGKGRHEALRETQLEFLNSEEYAHPYYWAAFIPSGNWREMNDN